MGLPRHGIRELKSKVAGLAEDLDALEALLEVDVPSSLNKIRFITEKVLQGLCKTNSVSWGQAEPTLERMIGPLVAADCIPKSIAIHVRTVQMNTSPGSHYQESALSQSHVTIAQNALIEFLDWYCRQLDGSPADSESKKPVSKSERTRHPVLWVSVISALCLTGAAIVVIPQLFDKEGKGPDSEKPIAAVPPANQEPKTEAKKVEPKGSLEVKPEEGKIATPPVKKPMGEADELQLLVTAKQDEIGNLVVKTLVPESLGYSNLQVSSNGKQVVVTITIKANNQINGARVALLISTKGVDDLSIQQGSKALPVNNRLLSQAISQLESILKLAK